MSRSSRSLMIVAVVAALVGIAVIALPRAQRDRPPAGAEPDVQPSAPAAERASKSDGPELEPASRLALAPEFEPSPEPPEREPVHANNPGSEQDNRSPEADSPSTRRHPPPQASELSEHNRQYLRDQVAKDLVPALMDCYTSALAANPELGGGTVALQFAVIGDPEVGGVVEYAEIVEAETTLASVFVSDCVRESTLAMTFDEPPEGGRFEISYPIMFEPE